MGGVEANIVGAAGYPRAAAAMRAGADQASLQKALWIDQAFKLLCGYREARIKGGAALYGNRNIIHVSVPWCRGQATLARAEGAA